MSYSGYDATPGSGLTFGSDLVSGKHYPRTKIAHGAEGTVTDVSTASPLPVGGAAADDAAAAGNPVPIGGVYQATVDTLDDGDVGRLRATSRRAGIVAHDFHSTFLIYVDVSGAGDIEVSTTGLLTGFGAPTGAFFDASNVGFTDAPRYIRIPMGAAGFRDCEMSFFNNTGVSCVFTVHAVVSWNEWYLAAYPIYSATVGNGSVKSICPYAGGSGAVSWESVPALANPNAYLVVTIDPTSDPSSGYISLGVSRRA